MFFRGLLATGLMAIVLSLIAVVVNRPAIENDLSSRLSTVYSAFGNDWARISVEGRDVSLTGKAPIMAEKQAALDAARRIYGVRVVNDRLETNPPVSPYTWSVSKDGKVLTLGGHVPSTEMRANIRDVSKKLYGDMEIKDAMKLADGAPEEDWKQALDFALQTVDYLGKGAVKISDSVVTIEGEAADVSSYNKIAEAFRGGPEAPDGFILASRVELPQMSPYVWSIEHVGRKVTLSGHVPSIDAHGEIVSRVRERFPRAEISDKMKLASGEPAAWDETIVYAINQLKKLRSGKVSLKDNVISISGEAADNPSYDSLMAAPVPDEISLKPAIYRPAALPYEWAAVWNGKRLDMTGYLPSKELRAKALKLVAAAFPGADSLDRTELASGEPENLQGRIAFALDQLKQLKMGSVTISNKVITLAGEAPDKAVLDKLRAAQPPSGAEFKIELEQPEGAGDAGTAAMSAAGLKADAAAISPYLWTARRIGGEIVLSGHVPSAEARSGLAELTARLFSGARIEDLTEIGAGAPKGWLKAARLALQQLVRIENGRVRLKDRTLSLRGQTYLASGREQLDALVKSGLPEGFDGTADISVKAAGAEMQYEQCQELVNRIISLARITFETGKASLTREGLGRLDRVAYTLRRCPAARIEIGGHTDSDGDEASNMRLSQDRADRVKKALVAAGIAAERMSSKGYGETSPIGGNDSAEDKARNRRIEFKLER